MEQFSCKDLRNIREVINCAHEVITQSAGVIATPYVEDEDLRELCKQLVRCYLKVSDKIKRMEVENGK